MQDKLDKVTLGTIINISYPAILAIVIWLFLRNVFNFNYSTAGYNDVLESIINFSSIIIGFYTAMYGVMIGLMDSDIFKIFRKNNVEGYFKYQLYDSLVSSFAILLLSIVMQVVIQQPKTGFTSVLFNLWIIILGYFIGTSFRSITLLLKLMFHHSTNDEQSEEDKKRKEEQKKLLKRP